MQRTQGPPGPTAATSLMQARRARWTEPEPEPGGESVRGGMGPVAPLHSRHFRRREGRCGQKEGTEMGQSAAARAQGHSTNRPAGPPRSSLGGGHGEPLPGDAGNTHTCASRLTNSHAHAHASTRAALADTRSLLLSHMHTRGQVHPRPVHEAPGSLWLPCGDERPAGRLTCTFCRARFSLLLPP